MNERKMKTLKKILDGMDTKSILILFLIGFALLGCLYIFSSCTIQTICTRGVAKDLVDDTQQISPNVSPTVTLPMNAIP